MIRELKSGERSIFGSSPCAWRHFDYIRAQTHARSWLLRWDVSGRSKQETSERFVIKNANVGTNVTGTPCKKKSKETSLTFITKRRARKAYPMKIAPRTGNIFLNKNYMQAVPTIYAGKSYMLFLHLLAFQTPFFCILHLPYPARFPWPPVTERQRWHSRVICGLLIIHSKSSATVAHEVQTSVLLPCSWELHQA